MDLSSDMSYINTLGHKVMLLDIQKRLKEKGDKEDQNSYVMLKMIKCDQMMIKPAYVMSQNSKTKLNQT